MFAIAAFGAAGVALLAVTAFRAKPLEASCGKEFVAKGPRCMPKPDAPARAVDTRVHVSQTTVLVGSSDWEAEGKVPPRTVIAGPFDVDAFEATEGAVRCPTCIFPSPTFDAHDAQRAASGLTRDEARVFCKQRGGRLPTEDEWVVVAAGAKSTRYPWGDTGAVCRRSAYGLVTGPCANGATGPDTVGAHPLGDSPLGVHDLAGNVAEWVEGKEPVVRGGSWSSSLATELRTWSREVVTDETRDARIGVRCVYDVAGGTR
jgi:formylglycine-generating enzyme required for sulfatase activity